MLRFANDLEEYGKVEQMPSLEGKKMFLYLSPKKAGVAKKSQQKMDRERREAEAKESAVQQQSESQNPSADNGLFANMKGGEEILNKLKKNSEEA